LSIVKSVVFVFSFGGRAFRYPHGTQTTTGISVLPPEFVSAVIMWMKC